MSKAVAISKGSGYDYIHPSWSLTEPVTLENRDQAIKEMSAKWSQREKLPQELRNIITDCTCKGEKGICYFCLDLLLNEVRPETGQELDDVILEKLCAGKFRHLADQKTFQLNQRTDTYFKLLGYDEEQWVDPIAEKELKKKLKICMQEQETYDKENIILSNFLTFILFSLQMLMLKIKKIKIYIGKLGMQY